MATPDLENTYVTHLCPKCNRAMISLRGFLSEGAGDKDYGGADPSMGGFGYSETAYEVSFIAGIWNIVAFLWKRRRLRPLFRVFPNSLYCTGCGYVDRRT